MMMVQLQVQCWWQSPKEYAYPKRAAEEVAGDGSGLSSVAPYGESIFLCLVYYIMDSHQFDAQLIIIGFSVIATRHQQLKILLIL